MPLQSAIGALCFAHAGSVCGNDSVSVKVTVLRLPPVLWSDVMPAEPVA